MQHYLPWPGHANKLFIGSRMDKEDVRYMYRNNGVLLSHKKKNGVMPFAATWVDPESVKLSEVG